MVESDRAAPSFADEETRTLSGHSRKVTSRSSSPDGACQPSGSGDETLKIWDAATGARFCGVQLVLNVLRPSRACLGRC